MKNKYFSVKDIVITAVILALLIAGKTIEKVIPDLPNGLGNIAKISEAFLLIATISVGFKRTVIALFIYIVVISLIFASFFIGGVFYVQSFAKQTGVYFLDYFIPLFLIAVIGLFRKLKKRFLILIAFGFVFLALLSHTISGIIFFKEYLEPAIKSEIFYWLLSFGLNLLGYVAFVVGVIPMVFLAKSLNKHNRMD
ncbi:hypothetical protein [Mycoplasma procyoni]|uniref:hypothetical protein n=1 Tax=Mycoplasma procyoni TaxID=568784 RepID=UPI00197B2367|nr:hypothetical protein [Mycoplasma procyoni]MBN3534790.1 hypothetical protein [Mycoplasma procyoni]